MKRVRYARAAVNDISDIWGYTEDRWGYAQAAAYDAKLEQRIRGVATGDVASQSAEEFGRGLRRVLAGRHVVFFHEDAEAVTVLRVLHQRVDISVL